MSALCVTVSKVLGRLKYANRGKEFMHFIDAVGSMGCSCFSD